MVTREFLVSEARRIGEEVAAKWADEVDRDGRFPAETVAELRTSGLLGAMVPARWGGAGASVQEMSGAISAIAEHCASSALVLAMHQIQIACLAGHGTDAARDLLLPRVVAGELLIANANSEVGLGGERRSSGCALEPSEIGFRLDKQASTVSYGEYADAIMATARRAEDSAPHDQVMAICVRPDMELVSTGSWDTLGLRGTCSRPGRLTADVPAALVITDYADVFVQTSLPVSLVLLGSVWMGIAEAAARRAHSSVRAQARKARAQVNAGSASAPSMGAFRLAELSTVLYQMRDVLGMAALEYERVKGTPEVERLQFTARMDTLKLSASGFVIDIVLRSMAICGLPSYMNGSPSSMARLVRDALAAPLMINNDRSLQASAQTMLIRKEL
ncbi:MAG TPA: acyl-CoA dehydrogenase family protein [Acidothermaceae bacterium]